MRYIIFICITLICLTANAQRKDLSRQTEIECWANYAYAEKVYKKWEDFDYAIDARGRPLPNISEFGNQRFGFSIYELNFRTLVQKRFEGQSNASRRILNEAKEKASVHVADLITNAITFKAGMRGRDSLQLAFKTIENRSEQLGCLKILNSAK